MSAISRRMGRYPGDMSQYAQTAAAMKQVTGPAARARYEAQREEQLLQAVQEAIAALEARGEHVSKTAIYQEVGVCMKTLENRPRVKAFLAEQVPAKSRQYRTKRCQQQEAELLEQVQQALEKLRATGQPISSTAICQLVNKSEHGLRSFPRVDAFVKQVLQEHLAQQRQQREAELLRLAQQGMETLRATGQPVTVRALCQLLDKGENSFRRYASIDTYLKQVVQESQAQKHQQREAELLLLVQQGVETLGANGQPVPIRALCQLLNKTETGLRRYASIDSYLKQVIAANARPSQRLNDDFFQSYVGIFRS